MEDVHHYDFTTASEFEIFIARLEEVIREWGVQHKGVERPLEEDDFKLKEWCYSSEKLTFSEAEFLLVRHHLKCETEFDQDEISTPQGEHEVFPQIIQDMLCNKNDFVPLTKPHPIARWYGLRDFIILIPQDTSSVASESRKKILLSAMTIASFNTKCGVPIFLQAMEPWQNYFIGLFQLGSFKTDFSMVHLKYTPKVLKKFAGLLYLFQSTLKGEEINRVTFSVRQTYVLNTSESWVNTDLTKEQVHLDFLSGDVVNTSELINLPLGSNYDPISELTLITMWPFLLEDSIYDGKPVGRNDLDPLRAPVWKVSVSKVENPCCLLTDRFSEFVALTKAKSSISELLGSLIRSNQSITPSELSSPLNVLTESKISAFSKAVMGVDKSSKNETKSQSQPTDGPISSENLMAILYYLFPDAVSDSMHPYSENLGGKQLLEPVEEERGRNIDKRLSKLKSAPYDGLVWRLAIVLSHVIYWMGGVRSAAFVWYEFVQELRFRWENGILVPGLELDCPDFKTCLLNQKLQLLNCCIARRIERDQQANKRNEEDSKSDEEEEFHDCSTELSFEEAEDGGGEERRAKIPPWDKPVGRLMRHGDLKLLETGDPLYIPKTQGPVPKTEDQVEEYAEFLLQLGTDDTGSKMRAKLMSSSLLSDMEAFKAANPGCILSDFIRWYSPRDWIEEDEIDEFGQKKGHLSDRMEIPGNTWLEVWLVAQPVPAMYQRRLFNDTRESEKVLDFLERRSPKEFVELLLPVMIACVIQRLLEEPLIEELVGTSETLSKLIKKAEILGKGKIEGERYEELMTEINALETSIVHASYLKHKFTVSLGEEVTEAERKKTSHSDLMRFIRSLLAGDEAEIPGGSKSDIASKIYHYFSKTGRGEPQMISDADGAANQSGNSSPFEIPHEKEVIIRLCTSRGPNRLHATFKKNEFRLCGAFTENIYYRKT